MSPGTSSVSEIDIAKILHETLSSRLANPAIIKRLNEDAIRWRWLRNQGGWPDSEAATSGFTPEQFDEMADEGIKKELMAAEKDLWCI